MLESDPTSPLTKIPTKFGISPTVEFDTDAFAARAGTRATTLAWWSSELSRRARASEPSLSAKSSTSSVTFLPVSVRSSTVTSSSRTLARIKVGGLTVEVEHGADAREVASLCRALAELAEC